MIENSLETLNDSKIYEMAKQCIRNKGEYLDKSEMEEILKFKKLKNKKN